MRPQAKRMIEIAAEDEAVDRERHQVAGLEEAHEEAHRDVRREAGEDAADERLAADPVAEVAGEVGQLVDAGGEDDRRREQEREACRVFVVEAAARVRRPS